MTRFQRTILADFYQKPARYYHATFDHLSFKKDFGKKVPTVLLTDIYLVDAQDNRIEINREDTWQDLNDKSIVADHCWTDFTPNWFNLPCELLQGDEIYFKSEVEKYPITRDELVAQRQQIWKDMQAENKAIYSAWQGSKRNYHGVQYRAMQESMKARMQANRETARKMQQEIPLVDYSLAKVSNLKIAYYDDLHTARLRYNRKKYYKDGSKYMSYFVKRSKSYTSSRKNY